VSVQFIGHGKRTDTISVPRLRAWLDASDFVQEAFLDVYHELDAYLVDPNLPPLLCLRLHIGPRLTTLHRQHLGTDMRDAG
jgi:RNA polymerase sigma-70 factor, ECF subfamily